MKNKAAFRADRILSYFQEEWVVLLAVTISGLIYNLGLLAGPWFEGKMTGYLVDILGGTKVFSDMLVLVICYVADHCSRTGISLCQEILRQTFCQQCESQNEADSVWLSDT